MAFEAFPGNAGANILVEPMAVAFGCIEAGTCSVGTVLLTALGVAAFLLLTFVIVAVSWRWHSGRSEADAGPSLATSEWPAMTTTLGGEVLLTNAACPSQGDSGRNTAEALITKLVSATPAQIYRMSRMCVRSGIAIERFSERASDNAPVVIAQLMKNDTIYWQVLPGSQVSALFPANGVPDADTLPICYARIEQGRIIERNDAMSEVFCARSGDRLLTLWSSDAEPVGRVRMTTKDGRETVCQYVMRRRDRAGVAGAEIFIAPPSTNGAAELAAEETLEEMPVALLKLDRSGRVMWGNAQARELVGDAFAVGEPLGGMVEPMGPPLHTLIEEALNGTGNDTSEMVRLPDEPTDHFAQIDLTRIEILGQETLLAVLTDASERRQLEDKFAQSHKMEAIGKLAGGVAHDFNNVLTAISGHCDLLLLRKDASHPDFSDLTQIRQNANRAAALVRHLLAFSRKQTLQPRLLSVQDVVSDTRHLLDRLIGETITLTVNHDRDLGSVRADHGQLEQALMNLVVNARDAMPQGGTVTIETRNRALAEGVDKSGVHVPAGDYVEISISDTGTGIDPKILPNVFDPFFTTKPKGEGTGLGLSTVYGIVKQSGGYICVSNLAEGGACFSIFLPRVHPDQRELAIELLGSEARQTSNDLTGQGAVLLVEDEAPVRSFASRALRLRGYRVIEADCAETAMDMLEAGNPVDVLVSDVVMPGMDGPTFAAKARKLRPGLRVVFVSGYAEESFRRNLTDTDFLFLPKPFSLNDLTSKVKEALTEPSVPSG